MEQLDLQITKNYIVQVAVGKGEVQRYEVPAMDEAEALSFVRQSFPRNMLSIKR